MLFALRAPSILLGLVAGFVVAMPVRLLAQEALAGPGRSGPRSLRAVRGRGALAWFDPYGVVAAAVGGVGWGPRPRPRAGARGAGAAPLLAALGVHAAFTAVGLVGFVAAGGRLAGLHAVDVSSVLRGDLGPGGGALAVTLGFAMINLGCGLLTLVPIPPLELGVLLWSRLPRSPGARRAAYHLLEEGWGVGALLVLVLVPLGGRDPLLLVIVDALAHPILAAL